MQSNSFRDLVVWQRAMQLVRLVFDVTGSYPTIDKYALVTQTRRAAISIPANIAEGRKRGTRKEYVRFLYIARGSVAELETHLEIATQAHYITPARASSLESLIHEVEKMLNGLIAALSLPRSKNLEP